MKNRVTRQLAIKQIISSGGVKSQEELLVKLHEQGYDVTQATLSRDLKALKVARISGGDQGYAYVIPDSTVAEVRTPVSGVNFLADGFRGLSFSGNLAVMKTRPGYASSIAAVLDSAEPYEIIGSIAGDDTILLVMREGITPRDLKNCLVLIMPKLQEKIG